jgi:hypothetical protein
MFIVDADPNRLGNGDLAIRTDNGLPGSGRLAALVYARNSADLTRQYAEVIAAALNAAFCPSMTDLMLSPEQIDSFMEANQLPADTGAA